MENENTDIGLPSVVHLTASAGRSGMGLSSVVWGLSRTQLLRGSSVSIWCCDGVAAQKSAQEYGVSSNVVVPFPLLGPQRLCFSPRMRRAAQEPRFGLEVLHQHGIWNALSEVATTWRSVGRPSMLAPHGMLEPWALRKSSSRKTLALHMFENKNLREAGCLHATSAAEIGDFRNFGLKGPVALIPNGVSTEWLESTGEADRFLEKFGVPKGRRVALFLSRITPKKGLPMLIEAWAAHRHRLQDWCLVIAGSDEFSHLTELVLQVEAASLDDSIIFLGPLYGSDKRDAFAASDVFVLPSHGEGAPMSVLDALGAGVPVLTTQKTPWEDLRLHRCGWWVTDEAGGIGEALMEISLRTREDLISWGARGKELVSINYSWESSADKCASVYKWLLRMGDRPLCICTS